MFLTFKDYSLKVKNIKQYYYYIDIFDCIFGKIEYRTSGRVYMEKICIVLNSLVFNMHFVSCLIPQRTLEKLVAPNFGVTQCCPVFSETAL